MTVRHPRTAGFTLVELMVTLAVVVILVMLATPSFTDLAQRSALRGAADGVVSLVGSARQEAIKRDAPVRIDYMPTDDGGFCVGASGLAGCDCNKSPAACDAGVYPETAAGLKRVRPSGTPEMSFVIDPKTGMLTDFSNTSSVELAVPVGYTIRVGVNAMARAVTCNPGDKPLPGVKPC